MTDRNLGRKLANRYALIKPIGQGAMGTVYLAKDTLLDDVSVAVKLLSQQVLNDRTFDRFQTEAKISALLSHKCTHVVRVIDQQLTQEGQPFYVMEYLGGKNISQIIRTQFLSIIRFLELSRQTCLALKAAHEGILFKDKVVPIIHRDIKPSNILVTQAKSGELVKILDFGIAKLLQASDDDDDYFLGTLAYSSPEQMDAQELDNRSDIYSLGITMYEMLTGKLPYKPHRNNFNGWHKAHTTYEPEPLKQVIPFRGSPELLNGVHDVVMGCLAKKRDQRPASVDEILTRLTRLQQGTSLSKGTQNVVLFRQRQYEDIQTIILPQQRQKTVAFKNTAHTVIDLNWFLRSQTWPPTIPPKAISLPKVLTLNKKKPLSTLWMMLSPQEIAHRMNNTRHNTFLCTLYPHPMVLWVTAFHSHAYGYRWFSNYLRIKDVSDRKFLLQLSDQRSYHGLLFSTQRPNMVIEICKFTITQVQCNLLKEWVMRAGTGPSMGNPKDSADLLKREFEKLKAIGFK